MTTDQLIQQRALGAVRTNGYDEATATNHLQERCPALGLWNETFTEFLRNE